MQILPQAWFYDYHWILKADPKRDRDKQFWINSETRTWLSLSDNYCTVPTSWISIFYISSYIVETVTNDDDSHIVKQQAKDKQSK